MTLFAPQDLHINEQSTTCQLSGAQQGELARYNIDWLKRQPTPRPLSAYAQKQRDARYNR